MHDDLKGDYVPGPWLWGHCSVFTPKTNRKVGNIVFYSGEQTAHNGSVVTDITDNNWVELQCLEKHTVKMMKNNNNNKMPVKTSDL